jgi:hypothetical protein
VVHTAEAFPGAPAQAGRRPTWRVASLHLIQEDASTASGVLLLYADLPADALAQLARDLAYTLVSDEDALYLDCIRAIDLGSIELLGEARRVTMDAAGRAAEEDERYAQEPLPQPAPDLPIM